MKDLAKELLKKKHSELNDNNSKDNKTMPNRVATVVKLYARELQKKTFLLHLNVLTLIQILNCINYLLSYEKPNESSLYILHVLLILSYSVIFFIRDSPNFFSEALPLTHIILESSNILYFFIIVKNEKFSLSFFFLLYHLFKCMIINCSFSLEVDESLLYYLSEIGILFLFNGEGTIMERILTNFFSVSGLYLCIIFTFIAIIHREYYMMVKESTAIIEWFNWCFNTIFNWIMKQNYKRKI